MLLMSPGAEATDRGPSELWRWALLSAKVERKWWRVGDSNPRPRRCERRALPTELTPHFKGVSSTHSQYLYSLAGLRRAKTFRVIIGWKDIRLAKTEGIV